MVNVGIIGCGRIAGHHARSIARTEGARLIAVCDLVSERAQSFHDEFGVAAYENYHRMLLEHPEIDTVAVVTPSGMHYEHVLDIISKHKKHVIVEKPTFMKPSQAREAYGLANAAGVSVFPVFQNRHNLAVTRVLEGLRRGELGQLRAVSVRVRWCRPQRYYDLAPWRGTFAMDGGCLTNQGIHHVDLLKMMGGPAKRVSSVHRTMGADIEVEDVATAIIEFERGAIGTVEVTTAARPIDYEASISLVCEQGLAQIGGIAVNELQVYTPDPDACERCSEDFSGNIYGNGHGKLYENIVASRSGNRAFPVSFEDALSTIQLLNAFYVSDERQCWTDVSSAGDSARLGRPSDELANLYRTQSQVVER